jgi:hypothetical protein
MSSNHPGAGSAERDRRRRREAAKLVRGSAQIERPEYMAWRKAMLESNPASADLVERPKVVYTGEFDAYTGEEIELLAGASYSRCAGQRLFRRRVAPRAPQLHGSPREGPEGEASALGADDPGRR